MMTEKYHCTPLEFEKQPHHIIAMHIDFMSADSEKRELDERRRQQEAQRKVLNKR